MFTASSPLLTSRFNEALGFACTVHANQIRKGSGVPYAAHLLGVASLALEYGATEDQAIAALLHDAVEDQGGAPRALEIRQRFGDAVADIVAGCTDTDVLPKPPWRARKEAYIAHVKTAPAAVRLVSACDKLHNARSLLSDYRELGDPLWARFSGGRDGTLWYYAELVAAFGEHGSTPLLRELTRVVCELTTLTEKAAVSDA